MKIAILSVSNKPTLPPDDYGYGGMERVSWWLAEELARLGHDVTFFAARMSVPPKGVGQVTYPSLIRNRFPGDRLMRLDMTVAEWFGANWLDQFDIIHELSHRMPIALFCRDGPVIATMQNPNPRIRWGKETRNLVALSPSHAKRYDGVPYVYNGVKDGSVPYSEDKSGPFLMMGVLRAYKGGLPTIEAAKRAGVPLVLAGTQGGTEYGRECQAAIEDIDSIQYVGEVMGAYKNELLCHARAAMLYVQWAEPGTIYGIEAMCAGTPIIGSRKGCVPDYVIDGKTGFLCESVEEMADAMLKVDQIDPQVVRLRYEDEFTVVLQAQRYLNLYERVMGGETW